MKLLGRIERPKRPGSERTRAGRTAASIRYNTNPKDQQQPRSGRLRRRSPLGLEPRPTAGRIHHEMPSRDRSLERPLDRAVPIASDGGNLERMLRSVMKVYVRSVEPDYTQPWQVFMEEECTGSGFAITLHGEAKAIVTNAHVVASYADIRIRKFGEVHKYKAQALMLAHTADVALLAVDDERFWHKVTALEFGEVPRLYENVKVLGYPLGGDNACVTRGVVSRVDTTSYVRGAEQLLVVQIDAAINSGNSGGPALDDRQRVAGVAFSGYAGTADNIGYIIPRVVVENVVADYLSLRNVKSSGMVAVKWHGLCSLGIWTQPCENPALRRKLQMADALSGVLVTRVASLGCGAAAGVCQGDVVLELGGITVANDGSVPLRGSERVHSDHLVTCRRRGEPLELKVLRDGQPVLLNTKLTPLPRLVPICDGFDAAPHYVVVAGLVLMALSAPLISAVTDDEDQHHADASLRYVDLLERDKAESDNQVVVWTQTLSHDVNFGYADLCRHLPRLKRINSLEIASLAHVVLLTRTILGNTPFLQLDFSYQGTTSTFSVVLDCEQAKAAETTLLRRSKVPAPYSPELKPAVKALAQRNKVQSPPPDDRPPDAAAADIPSKPERSPNNKSNSKHASTSNRRNRKKTHHNSRAPPSATDDSAKVLPEALDDQNKSKPGKNQSAEATDKVPDEPSAR